MEHEKIIEKVQAALRDLQKRRAKAKLEERVEEIIQEFNERDKSSYAPTNATGRIQLD